MTEVRISGVESQSTNRSQPIQNIDGDGSKMNGGQVGVVAGGGGGGVQVEVGNAGGGAEVVKRKRGRPPKAQANAAFAKKSKEEDEEEDVCFICFDGGSLVLCDRRGCPKAYHPSCVKRDEAFFRSKAKWNCGWHICSICEKTAHHMCYTCTYSLCKGCIRMSDYVCVRGDKGFCTVCIKTIMLIENSCQGKEGVAKVDFDDKTSWEYLFKVYWVYIKGKLALTLDELTQATNPWKRSSTIALVEPNGLHISASGRRSITSDLSFGNPEANESKRRKMYDQTYDHTNGESPSTVGCKEWASKELLDFVAHMKNGDTSYLSQFDVQALLLEYIKINNLRDPQKKTQIICDLRLMNLFGKPRVGHIEMLKLLESHFSIKDDSQKNTINKERRNHRKGVQHTIQNKLEEYAAIDVHNMNLIYLRRNFMESLIEDREKFHEMVVGSIVQISISGSDQKDDMYRLVQVVGTTKADVPYKIGDKLVDVMLEVLNLDKKETVSIDTISNQELSEDECRRLRESIRCGLVRCFTVGEIQEKAMALQSLLLDDRMKTEMLRLNHLRDQASKKGQKKGLRECVQKLKLLKTPEERERRLREVPEINSDPKMNLDYESDDTEEYFNNEHGEEHLKPKFSWVSGTNTISPKQIAENLNDQPRDSNVETFPNVKEDSREAIKESNTGKDEELKSNIASKSTPSFPSPDDDKWHYRDPSGNVQGPFSMVQLQSWSSGGYFPADMRVWANQEADSLLLINVLKEHINNQEGQSHENVASNNKVGNQIPSSTINVTPYAVNPVNLEKLPVNRDSSVQSCGQNWNISDYNLNCNPPNVALDTQNMPSPLPNNVSHEDEKVQDGGGKEPSVPVPPSKLLVQDTGNPTPTPTPNPNPSWSTTLSLVVGGPQLPEPADEWGRYPPTTNSTMDQIMHSSPPPSSQPWHGLREKIEFNTLAEESVSDLLAEVDAMESRNGVPSPTSRRNSFLEDLFNGSIDDFSPTGDQGTRHAPFSLELKSTCVVSIPQTANSDNMGFKWPEMGGSEVQPLRQDMFDLNDSTRAEADEGNDDRVEEKPKSHSVVMAHDPGGRKSKGDPSVGQEKEVERIKTIGGFPVAEEEGEFVQPETAPLLPLPPPPPPPPLTMGLDVVDSHKAKNSERPSQGTTSTSRVHGQANASRSGNIGRDSHHRRSGGVDRYSSNSPRERGHHVEDSGGYSRSSRASWSRQSSIGGGYLRPPSKSQRVCKFYESGRCKKGSACNYLHPQDR